MGRFEMYMSRSASYGLKNNICLDLEGVGNPDILTGSGRWI